MSVLPFLFQRDIPFCHLRTSTIPGLVCLNHSTSFADSQSSRYAMELRMKNRLLKVQAPRGWLLNLFVWKFLFLASNHFDGLALHIHSGLPFCAALALKCVGASMGEKPPMTRKLPPSTTVCLNRTAEKLQYDRTTPCVLAF